MTDKIGDQKQPLQVFKLQRPLMTNGSFNEVLCYNKDRSIQSIFKMKTNQMIGIFKGAFKVYVEGYVGSDNQLHIEKFLPEQDW